MNLEWFRRNSENFHGELLFAEPLARHTYYRIGGAAAVLAVPKTHDDLKWLVEGIQASRVRFFLLGAGSNVLVSDEGYAGLVIRLTRINLDIQPLEEVSATRSGYSFRIRTGASVSISTLLRRAAQEGWSGLEFLTGIPGSVGGAVFMNGGTHLGETKDRLKKVEIFSLETGQMTSYEGDELQFEYRRNLFLSQSSVIWTAEWEVQQQNAATVKSKIDDTLARRKSTQPLDRPSCGSVFKNPKESGFSAWQVVDKLGLRGHREGDAQFSEKHSNFIVNLARAKASDVRALIELAKKRAREELGIALEEEVIYVGF